MDTEPLVTERMMDGQTLLSRLQEAGFHVTVAAWLRPVDASRWYFYVVSSIIAVEGFQEASCRLDLVVRAIPQPFSIQPLDINLLDPDDATAKELVAIGNRIASTRAAPYPWDARTIGNLYLAGAYVYPPPAAVTT